MVCIAASIGCTDPAPEAPSSPSQPPANASSPSKPNSATESTSPKRATSLRALKLLEGNRFDEAWEECQKVLLQSPNDPRALYVAAQVLNQRNKLDQALQMVDQIPLADPEYGIIGHRSAIQWCFRASRLEDCERRSNALLAKVPNDIESLKGLAANLDLQGRRFEASQIMQRLVATGQSDITNLILAIDTAKPVQSEGPIRERLQQSPNSPHLLGSLGFSALYEKQPQQAETHFREALQSSSASAAIHVGLGIALVDQEKFDALPDWLARAPLPAVESIPAFWRVLGLWCQHREQYPDAIYCLTRSVELDPFDFLAIGPLAACLAANGQQDAARAAELIFQAIQLTNRNVNYTRDGHRKPEWMLQVADRLEQHGRTIEALAWREWCEQSNGNDKAKIQNWQSQRAKLAESKSPHASISGLAWNSRDLARPDLSALASRSPDRAPTSDPNAARFAAAGAVAATLRWTDVAQSLGAQFQYDNGDDKAVVGMQTYQSNGAGASVLDYDRDGWPDLMVLQGGGDPRIPYTNQPSVLFANRGGQRMVDVARSAHALNFAYGQGAAVGDWDQDGFPDLFLLNFGQNRLLRNQGDGTFEQIDVPGMRRDVEKNPVWSVSGAIADVNGDHLPDLIEINYSSGIDVITHLCVNKDRLPQVCRPTEFPPSRDYIYLSDGFGGFEVANTSWGLDLADGRGLGIIVGNLDEQHGNDIYIANDMSANNLLISAPDPTRANRTLLADEAVRRGCAVDNQGKPQASMGVGCADVDRNGTLDLFVTNFIDEYNALYLQNANRFYQDASRRYRLIDPKKKTLGFGTHLMDLDLDGWMDMFIVNGHVDDYRSKGQPYEMLPQVFLQRDGAFVEQPTESYGDFFSKPSLSRSLGVWDFNRDGKLDWVVTHLDQPLSILKSESQSDGHWFMLELVGTDSERDAIGTVIEIHCGEESWRHQRLAGNGFECSNEPWIFLGLGRHATIDRLDVHWPSGKSTTIESIPADRRVRLVESQTELLEERLEYSSR